MNKGKAITADTAWQEILPSRAGVVVDSVFEHTINLKFGSSPNLYSLFSSEGYNAPNAMLLDTVDDFRKLVGKGEQGELKDSQLVLPRFTVDASGCLFVDNSMPKLDLAKVTGLNAKLDSLGLWLKNNAREGSFFKPINGDPVSGTVVRMLQGARLKFTKNYGTSGANSSASYTALADDVSKLVGLGVGLTPSGDDYLVGFLSVVSSLGNINEQTDGLSLAVSGLLDKTTAVSRVYLSAATKGLFAEPVRSAVVAMANGDEESVIDSAKKLIKHGATSGQDILVGMLDAWCFLKKGEYEIK